MAYAFEREHQFISNSHEDCLCDTYVKQYGDGLPMIYTCMLDGGQINDLILSADMYMFH